MSEENDRPLTRDEILGINDIRVEFVHDVPGWGTVAIKNMTSAERDEFEESLLVGKGQNRQVNVRNLRAKLIARCLVDADGNRLFTEKDIPALGKKSAAAINVIFTRCQVLNGLTEEQTAELTEPDEPIEDEDASEPVRIPQTLT